MRSAVFKLAESKAGAPIREGLLAGTMEHLISVDVEIRCAQFENAGRAARGGVLGRILSPLFSHHPTHRLPPACPPADRRPRTPPPPLSPPPGDRWEDVVVGAAGEEAKEEEGGLPPQEEPDIFEIEGEGAWGVRAGSASAASRPPHGSLLPWAFPPAPPTPPHPAHPPTHQA